MPGQTLKKSFLLNNEEIAFLEYTVAADEVQIIDLKVQEKYRRQGYASRLIRELITAYPGQSYVILEVRASNQPAQNLYKKMGFRELNRRKNYYPNPVEDAVVMKLELKPR
jgi:ribosomal-protein-alanine N-acetyltransferase